MAAMPPHPDALLRHQQCYTDAIRAARRGGPLAFQSWFNKEASHTMQQVVSRGHWDVAMHILTPAVCARISRPEEQTALEIGYGGGRLINAASRYFKQVIGIDIHAETRAAAAFLREQGATNTRLIRTAGATIDVADECIDFVYSFIVLQHLPSFAVFEGYIHETYRCLRPGGVAQLYYGAFSRLHPLLRLRFLARGYREVAGRPANHITLVIRDSLVKRLCRAVGFQVVESGSSYYLVPDGYPHRRGGQHYVTLVKP